MSREEIQENAENIACEVFKYFEGKESDLELARRKTLEHFRVLISNYAEFRKEESKYYER